MVVGNIPDEEATFATFDVLCYLYCVFVSLLEFTSM